MANKKKKKVKSAFEVLDQRRNEEIAQMSKGSSNTAKKLNKILAPSSKEQISSGTIKTSNPTSISYATSNTRDISRQIIAPTSSMFSSTANELSSPVDLVKNMQEQQENERQKRKVEQLKKKVEQEKQKQGILTSTEMQDIVVNENFGSKKNYLPDNVKTEKTQLDKQREKATGQEIKKAIAPVSEIAKQNNKKLENYKKTSDTYKDYVLNQKQFNKYIDSNSRKWFNSGAFGDGYDFGDITKTILGTASDIQGDVITGAGRILEGTIDTGAWLLGKGAELTGNKKLADKTKNFIKKDFIEETGFNERASNSGTIGLINSLVNKDDNMFTAPVQLAKNLKKGDNFLASLKKSGTSSNYESNSFFGDKSDSLAESVGQLLGTVGLQAVGVPWWVTTGTTSFGGEAQNAFNEGATYNEAGTSALINAGAEILTEKLSGGISFGGKTLDKGLKNTLTKSISNETMKTLTKLGFDMTGEGAEEVLSSVISNVGKKLTYEDDETWNEMLLSKESMDEYLESFIGGAIMGGGFNVGKAVNSIKTGRDYDTGFSKNEQLIIDSEINNRLNALDKSKLTTKEKNKIKKEVQEDLKNGNLSIDTIESALAEKEYNKYKQEENKIKELKSQIKKLNSKKIVDLTVEDYENLNTQKKAIEEQISNLNNSTSKQELQTKMRNILSSDNGFIQKSYQEANLRNEKFTYETKDTDSDYRKTLTKEFEDKGNNSTKAHNQYEMLVKLSEDKGVQYHITNNKELSKLSNANKNINPSDIEGFVRTNKDGNKEILINIDSNRAINRIVGHETTHLFEGTKEYDELKDFAKQYATTKGEYDSRLKSTQELYKNVENTNIENEVTANIVGDYIFTDTDFINNLSTEKPNIFKRVYEEIKHLYKMATAGSKEERQLLQLKKSFEKIYQKNEIQTDTKTKYHISKNLNNKIDEVLSDVTVRNPVKLRDFTPDILVQNGVKDLPMYENPSHIRKNILTENEAKKLGLSINKNDHYHGLGKELYIDAIDSLDNPRVIFKRNNSNNYLILTTLKDNNGNNIVVPIEIETTTNINRIKIDTNRIKSVYGYKTINNIDLNDYIKRNIKNSNFTKIYEQKKERGTGFSTAAGSFHKDNIPQSNTNVKSDTSSTKYSIQNNENDTQRTEKSSFSFTNAKQYDDLIKTNYIEYYRKDNGDVKVYLMDSNNNLLNEFSLWSNTNASKELGENLGNKIYETATDTSQKIDIGNDINNLGTDTDYFMNHRPSEGYGNASNFEENMPDIFEHPEWYLNLNEKYNKESLNALKKVRNNPEAELTIYRATIGNKINYGDWITPSKSYAEYHNNSQFDGKGNIVEMKVKAKDIQFAGDDINEWGYFPNDNYSLSNKNKQIAPSRNDIYGSDIKYQPKIKRQLEEKKHKQIAPIVKENKVKAPVTKDMLPYIEMGKIVSGEASYKEVENFLNNTNGEKEPKLKKGTLAPVRTSNTKLQQIKDKAVEAVHWGQYLVTNRNEAIDRFSKQTGNKNIKFLADHLNNVQGEISTNINNAQIDNNGKKIGKSLVDIFVPAKKEKLSESFNDYLFHLSNIERHKNEKGSLVPLNESETLVKEYEKTYPQMKNWAKDVNTYNKNLLYKQAEAGLITKDTADYLSNKYKFYVPFIENIDGIRTNDTGKIITKSTVKSARGGSSKNLLGFEEAMIRQTQSAITQIRKNQLYNEIIETMPEKTIDFETNTNPNIFEGNLTTDKQNYLLSSYKDGKMQQAKISKELYRNLENKQEKALKELEAGLSFITKPLQKISNVRRNILTTWSPPFFITNPIKDLQDALLNSKYAKDWSKNILKSFKELTTGKGEHLNEFLNMYGQGNLWGGENVDSGVYDVTKLAKTKNKVNAPSANNNKILKFSKKMIKKVPQINELMELAPRYAEYLASIENGATQMEALYNAREITTNFGRGGILTKFLNRNGFTFLNASTQGFSKLIRNFSGENGAKGVIGASAKVIALGVAPALFNALWFDDDDDYNDLPDYIKDNYYLLKTDDNDFVRIPKGRMISIFGSAARRTLERSKGKRNEMTLKEDFESYVKNAWNQVGVGSLESNNIYAPIKQVKTGKYGEAWYGGEIVPKRLQDKPDEEQYDSSIDKASIWIGKKLGISPYKVNYVIDQYSGGIGDMILPTITDEAQSDSNSVVGTMLAPLKDKFMANSITDNKNVSNFYTKSEELQKNANSKDATIKDHAVSGYMGIISKEMGALYQEMREVQENNDLSKSEKFKKALIIKDEINRLATEGMNGYNKVEMVSNYAIIGDREIYEKVNSKGEYYWDEPDDEDLYTLNSLGLTVSEKGTYYNAQQQIYSSWDEYDDYNESKKNALDYLINTSLPDKAKYQLYNNNYDKKQNINVAQTIGIDANTFLKYKQQNFEADKNKKGYPISGSRKRKVYNYLNKMNINYEDRLILAKLQGYKNDEDNVDIINYLDKMDITYEEYEQTLKELGFKIKNGYVRWD